MRNLQINFEYPWLLLLLVPAVLFTLISYFRLAKRYRKTRNRISSIVLHLLVMALSVCTLSGMMLHYEVPNDKNEILLLVDVSDTEKESSEARDRLVKRVLDDGRHGNYKIGVVTFGFDQEYAVPLTYDVDKIYNAYLQADLPDTSATDIASALEYIQVNELFQYPETAKIILITDGKQTDREAETAIRAVTAQGTRIDVANVASAYVGADVYVKNVEFPEYHVNKKEECTIVVNVESNEATKVDVTMFDNGVVVDTKTEVELVVGEQKIAFNYSFEEEGLHQINFSVAKSDDVLVENNSYTACYYLEVYNKLLIVERLEGESEALVEMLGKEYDVTVTLVSDTNEKTGMPKTVDELRAYDQVILNNIANEDMPSGFDVILESYVSNYGGGLFTIGGKKEGDDGKMVSNAYKESDMYGTLYQEMLPVEAIRYTPPMGLVIIIDSSGSMGGTDNYGETYLRWAKTATLSCLNALSERDYISVLTLDDYQSVILPMTPRTQDTVIRDAIESIDFESPTGGTVFPNTVYRAGQALLTSEYDLARKHIIMISDGATAPEDVVVCEGFLKTFYEEEITFSFIGVDMTEGDSNYNEMKKLTDAGHGNLIIASGSALLNDIQKELIVTKVESMNDDKEFNPIISDITSPLVKDLERYKNDKGQVDNSKLAVKLYGYHGVRARENADVILKGEYNVPIYAQWKYGAGTVGSFMCDLQASTWSKDFVKDENGIAFIARAINNLMPSSDIRVKDIAYTLHEDNYTNQLSVFPKMEDGQWVKGSIVAVENNVEVGTPVSLNEKTVGENAELRKMSCYVTMPLALDNNYSRCDFVVKKGGTYKIVMQIVDAEGNPIVDGDGVVVPSSVVTFYKAFAYSEEYIPADKEDEAEAALVVEEIAKRGQGSVIQKLEDPVEVYEGFVTELPKTFDPRWLFMILAIIFFLTDVAVRKFKFKWPHELIREYKEKKKAKKD